MAARLPRQKIFLADFVPLGAAPASPKIGTVVCADGVGWDPLEAGEGTPYLVMSAVVGEGRGWVSPVFSSGSGSGSGGSVEDPKTTEEYELAYDLTSILSAVPGIFAHIGESGVDQNYLVQVIVDVVGVSANYAAVNNAEVTVSLAVNGSVLLNKVLEIPSNIAGAAYSGQLLTFVFQAVVETSNPAVLSLRAAVTATPGSGNVRLRRACISAQKTATGYFE